MFFFIIHTLIFELDFYKSESLYSYNSKLVKSPKRFKYNIYIYFELKKQYKELDQYIQI